MYSRDFGGIKSEGQLYNFEQEYNRSGGYESYSQQQPEEVHHEPPKQKGLRLDFLRNLKLDDLILIGIGLLLLLDSDEENDIFTLIIALMLMF